MLLITSQKKDIANAKGKVVELVTLHTCIDFRKLL